MPWLAMAKTDQLSAGRDEMRDPYRDRTIVSCFRYGAKYCDMMGKLSTLHPTILPGKPPSWLQPHSPPSCSFSTNGSIEEQEELLKRCASENGEVSIADNIFEGVIAPLLPLRETIISPVGDILIRLLTPTHTLHYKTSASVPIFIAIATSVTAAGVVRAFFGEGQAGWGGRWRWERCWLGHC